MSRQSSCHSLNSVMSTAEQREERHRKFAEERASSQFSLDSSDEEEIPAERQVRRSSIGTHGETAMGGIHLPAGTVPAHQKEDVADAILIANRVTVQRSKPEREGSSRSLSRSLHKQDSSRSLSRSLHKQDSSRSLDSSTKSSKRRGKRRGSHNEKDDAGSDHRPKSSRSSLGKQNSSRSLRKQCSSRSLEKQSSSRALRRSNSSRSLEDGTKSSGRRGKRKDNGDIKNSSKERAKPQKQKSSRSLRKQGSSRSLRKQRSSRSIDTSTEKVKRGGQRKNADSEDGKDPAQEAIALAIPTFPLSLRRQSSGRSLNESAHSQRRGGSLNESSHSQRHGGSLNESTHSQRHGGSLDESAHSQRRRGSLESTGSQRRRVVQRRDRGEGSLVVETGYQSADSTQSGASVHRRVSRRRSTEKARPVESLETDWSAEFVVEPN